MGLFLSSFEKKIDKKGRVSVPATFRGALTHQNFSGIIVYPSFVNPCIEACGMDRIEKLHEQIESLDPFSEERDAFAAAIMGGSVQLSFDGEGRVNLPEALLEEIGIDGEAVFVGKGETFEIWRPEDYKDYAAAARALAKERRGQLRSQAKRRETGN
jgi:MraZ protein